MKGYIDQGIMISPEVYVTEITYKELRRDKVQTDPRRDLSVLSIDLQACDP